VAILPKYHINVGHLAKQKYERMALALNVIRKKVLCSAEKSSVIWAEPHSRSSAEQFCRTERSVDHYWKGKHFFFFFSNVRKVVRKTNLKHLKETSEIISFHRKRVIQQLRGPNWTQI
jgi:hypothetical protein